MTDPLSKLKSEPALAWKLAVGVLGADPESARARLASSVVRDSPLVQSLIAGRDGQGRAYKKWNGEHWLLSILADLGYPTGDERLRPLMEEVYACWLSKGHEKHIRVIDGRVRPCASQEANAAWSSMRLGLADRRTDELITRLLKWQWEDGGWNCDKNPEAKTSSFMETLIPLRALSLYGILSGEPKVKLAAEQAAEVFLSRRLFKRRSNGQVMNDHFICLHYPPYWHYDVLSGLKVMAEAGLISDPRCAEALDLLESKRLPEGGFPAEESYSRQTRPDLSGYSVVDWGGTSKSRMNAFVTADALFVLRSAGR